MTGDVIRLIDLYPELGDLHAHDDEIICFVFNGRTKRLSLGNIRISLWIGNAMCPVHHVTFDDRRQRGVLAVNETEYGHRGCGFVDQL